MYKVRKAINADIPKIMELLIQVGHLHHEGRPDLFNDGITKYTQEELAQILADEKRPVFVYEDEEGKVYGHAFCIHQESGGNHVLVDHATLYIDDICVDEAARGKHVGRTIYQFVEDYARKNGYYNVTLNVWACNTGAHRFYEVMGMKPQKYGMEKIL